MPGGRRGWSGSRAEVQGPDQSGPSDRSRTYVPSMATFVRRSTSVGEHDPGLRLAWLAGLLEAEGTFIRPIPSEPGLPIVACQMTDRDVVERVAHALGTTVTSIPRQGRRPIYATRIKGHRAVLLMRDLAPAMGDRRHSAIAAAVAAYRPPCRKLDFVLAERIRLLRSRGASVSSLARRFRVTRPTIRQVTDRSIYAAPAFLPWRVPERSRVGPFQASDHMTLVELHWLSGWLEGEGSFVRPPPSDLRRARILGCTRDTDVAREVGRLLRVKPLFTHDARERLRGWSGKWRLLKRGRPAAELMQDLHPLMGSRRQAQIESALGAIEWR